MRTLSDGALIGHDNGCSQGQFPLGASDLVDTPVHAHSIQAEAQFLWAAGAYPIQVSIPCPPMVDRAKRSLQLVISFVTITRTPVLVPGSRWARTLKVREAGARTTVSPP